ncbi:hypothetical protein ACIPY2_07575 [Paenarthrobacter sp. NPDC089675]|uniref:hypothetical protein n=1 Tax=Paenarthrobacter sp. NPDC089675 TaxID=3364376 RepID=UPI003808F901
MTESGHEMDSELQHPDVPWPVPVEATGDTPVDRALGLLDGIGDLAVSGHAERYSALHDSLLEALDAEPGLPPAAPRKPEGSS